VERLWTAVTGSRLAALIVHVDPERYEDLRSRHYRLFLGAITTQISPAGEIEKSQERTLVLPATDRSDTGWVVGVKYQLSEPLSVTHGDPLTGSLDGASHLLEDIRVVDREGHPPHGVLITFSADAFLLTQDDAAFKYAQQAAVTIVGRALRDDESAEAVRGLYYA
jgi:hypothetical protein